MNGVVSVPAVGFWRFIEAARARGYHVRPDEVPTPASNELAAFNGSVAERAMLRQSLSLDLDFEARALQLARSLETWAAAPSAEEEAEQRRRESEEAARRATIENRAQSIIDSAEVDRRAKAMATARKQAEREIGGAE